MKDLLEYITDQKSRKYFPEKMDYIEFIKWLDDAGYKRLSDDDSSFKELDKCKYKMYKSFGSSRVIVARPDRKEKYEITFDKSGHPNECHEITFRMSGMAPMVLSDKYKYNFAGLERYLTESHSIVEYIGKKSVASDYDKTRFDNLKPGTRILIKDRNWYLVNLNKHNEIEYEDSDTVFIPQMVELCGKWLTITDVVHDGETAYSVKNYSRTIAPWMIADAK